MRTQRLFDRKWIWSVGFIVAATACVQAAPPPLLVWYMGDTAPTNANSGGSGVSFTIFGGANSVELGELVYDATAIDATAWRVTDASQTLLTKYRSNLTTIDCATGATILGRVRVPSQQGSKGTNIQIYDDADGGTAGYFWGGAGVTPGLIQESFRTASTTVTGDANYHILRLTMNGGSTNCPGVNRVIKLYFDENPTAVLTINPAANATEGSSSSDYFGFGATNGSGRITIYFDWVTASNQGAFAPGEEVAVLGQSLAPSGPPACKLNVVPEAIKTATAVQGQPATPNQILYTPFNAGQTTLSYTVTKVPDDATTAWLSVNPTSGGPLGTGAQDTVTASIDPTGLSIGVYSVQLRFTSNDCVPASEVTRTVQLTVTGSLAVTPSPGFSVPAEPVTPKTRSFTVTNVGTSDLNYSVAKLNTCDWLTLNNTSGGPIPPAGTATVTVTVDPTGIASDQICTLRFTNAGNPAETADRTVTLDVLDSVLLLSYQGDVHPADPGSFVPGHSFALTTGPTSADQGSLLNDPAALDGKAWRIVDDDTHRARWNSTGSSPIETYRGATIVGRVAIETITGTLRPANLAIRESSGLSAEYYFAGPHANSGRAGRVSECIRQVDSAANPAKANSNYHILRMTVIGGPDTGLGRTIRLYIDEAPTPALEVPVPASEEIGLDDDFGFGADQVDTAETIKFDYVRATNAGAFAPGEDCAVLGECLVLPEPGACCKFDQSCENLLPAACAVAGGTFEGIGTSCATFNCPFTCNTPPADADNDDDVDLDDFGAFQSCYNGAGVPFPTTPVYCVCFDKGDDAQTGHPVPDGDIDAFDFVAFQNCATRSGMPAVQNCGE